MTPAHFDNYKRSGFRVKSECEILQAYYDRVSLLVRFLIQIGLVKGQTRSFVLPSETLQQRVLIIPTGFFSYKVEQPQSPTTELRVFPYKRDTRQQRSRQQQHSPTLDPAHRRSCRIARHREVS